ncbi:aldehyde-activating protein [Oceanicola sp. 22II-s10i]|uniref:GFA family protein n=1 Tax=Oceanicola sp. 22II-s10i TaxID=1317116 RepID=UPI000B52760D|nr:GFA family protein [Oceanicola sp. 22II-s10i]OWU84237.1 aldehyde-activating protein [Oceanicola sp. 22II-s10i]
MNGRCTCGAVRYRMADRPLHVHCCHCTWCQRESGSAFAVNALIEMSCLEVEGRTEAVVTPTSSRRGQIVHRCPTCQVALWSHYGMGPAIAFVRVGTLETPAACPPDVHIYTESKLPWVTLPEGVPALEGFYKLKDQWADWAYARFKAAREAAG